MGIHQGRTTLFAALWRCLWGRGQRGNSAARLLISSPLSNKSEPSCETGSFSHLGNCHSPQLPLSLSFPLSQPLLPSLPPHCSQPRPSARHQGFSELALEVHCLTSLVVLVDFFFNSLVVKVPCRLIFWHFWLFIDFRLVVILLLVVRGSEGFLPTPPSWLEPP